MSEMANVSFAEEEFPDREQLTPDQVLGQALVFTACELYVRKLHHYGIAVQPTLPVHAPATIESVNASTPPPEYVADIAGYTSFADDQFRRQSVLAQHGDTVRASSGHVPLELIEANRRWITIDKLFDRVLADLQHVAYEVDAAFLQQN